MIETDVRLSNTFESEDFSKTIEFWNLDVADNAMLDDKFWEKANKRIKRIVGGHTDDDDMTREVIYDALSHAISAEDFKNSSAGWIDLGMDADIDHRQTRTADFRAKQAAVLAALGEGLDPFEAYALERHLPIDRPKKAEKILSRIAMTKSDLINFDNFTKENEGQVFRNIGILALHTGKFSGDGIAIDNGRIVIPSVEGSAHFAIHDSLSGEFRIHEDPGYSIDARAVDNGIIVQDTPRLLNADNLYAVLHERKTVWSLGELPYGPLVYGAATDSHNYEANLDFFEAHINVLRAIGDIAAKAA
jgi:hypothetical protein